MFIFQVQVQDGQAQDGEEEMIVFLKNWKNCEKLTLLILKKWVKGPLFLRGTYAPKKEVASYR